MSDHHAPGLLDTIICLAKSTKRIKGLQAADTRVRSWKSTESSYPFAKYKQFIPMVDTTYSEKTSETFPTY